MRILVSWIGHADLCALAHDSPPDVQTRVKKAIRRDLWKDPGHGPVRTLLENEDFDEVHLISTYPQKVTADFKKWLPSKVNIRLAKLENPTDYRAIFEIADRELKAITTQSKDGGHDLFLFLSPGTPAMASIWVLLGKTTYPARFLQAHKDTVSEEAIPFDISLEIPEIVRRSDEALLHLATQSPGEVQGFENVIGDSQAIRIAVGRARRAAVRDVPVLLTGESGTGKELFARAIHKASLRKEGPFVPINSAAMPTELIESELFGHEAGAFTGAKAKREGAFARADGGTLFLDEIGELDLMMQAKLLRVLQPPPGAPPATCVYTPIGGATEETADVRIVAATNRDLHKMMREGEFREDLFYRLAVIIVRLPPLRGRKQDIATIARSLLDQINRDFRARDHTHEDKSISDSASRFVKRHTWPGNVRQLYNALLQAAVMSDGTKITDLDLRLALAEMPEEDAASGAAAGVHLGEGFALEEHLDAIMRHLIERAMVESGFVKSKATRLLGLPSPQNLQGKIDRLGIKWKKAK